FDPASGNLFLYGTLDGFIHEYTPDGTEVLPRIPTPASPSSGFDLDFAPEAFSVGGTLVPAGTLLAVASTGKTLYAVNKNDGTVLASVVLALPDAPVGGSYDAQRHSFFVVDFSSVYEVNPATGTVLQSFPFQPAGSPPFAGATEGDLEV